MPELHLELKPSLGLLLFCLGLHCMILGIAVMIPMPWWYAPLLLLLCCWTVWRYWLSSWWNDAPDMIDRIEFSGGKWWLLTRAGQYYQSSECRLVNLGLCVKLEWLQVHSGQSQQTAAPLSVLIAPDSVPRDMYRRLMVVMR